MVATKTRHAIQLEVIFSVGGLDVVVSAAVSKALHQSHKPANDVSGSFSIIRSTSSPAVKASILEEEDEIPAEIDD